MLAAAINDLISQLPAERKVSHPLSLLRGVVEDERDSRGRAMERALQKVRKLFPAYSAAKEQQLVTETDLKNVAALLGEIRTLAALTGVWGESIETPASGSDFVVSVGTRKLKIEVATPTGSTVNTQSALEVFESDNVKMTATSHAPFGHPTDERPQDAIQGNAVSRLAAIKQKEHQADDSIPSILWLDLEDMTAFPSTTMDHWQAQPLVGGATELVSGVLWWMNYGKRGDPIFDSWSLSIPQSRHYHLEFDGRFARDSRFVATVAAVGQHHVVHQSHRSRVLLNGAWIVELLQLNGAHFEEWWVEWPVPGSLAYRIEAARRSAHSLLEHHSY